MFHHLSIIIPLPRHSQSWKALAADFKYLPERCEILFVGVDGDERTFSEVALLQHRDSRVRFVTCEESLSIQCNFGVRNSTKSIFWFLLPTSRVPEDVSQGLLHVLEQNPHGPYFFPIEIDFRESSFSMAHWLDFFLRRRVVRFPLLDQGLCMSRKVFTMVGGFLEAVPMGHDFFFSLRAEEHGLEFQAVHSTIKGLPVLEGPSARGGILVVVTFYIRVILSRWALRFKKRPVPSKA